MMVQIYAGTLRSCGEVKISLYAGLAAVAANLVLDYVLIFGKLGFPKLGVTGAAVATVAARYVECFAVVISSHCKVRKLTYIRGVFRSLKVPVKTVYELFVKGFPLFLNEALYSLGIVALFQSYSMRGIVTVAAINISFALEDIADILMIAMGDATAIIMGQLLGADMLEEAKTENKRILFLSAAVGMVAGLLLFGAAFIFPNLYNTSEEIQHLARTLIILQALFTPQNTLVNSIYYTLRAGGRSVITCLFDSVFLLVISVPLAYALSIFTELPSYLIFAAVNLVGIFKCLIGLLLVRKGIWVRNIIEQ
jgi:Na+-driven multidrug efflux pump